jgi:hypothetical protein
MNLPFHTAAAGSHTSILISESLEGRIVAAKRQNAGVSAYFTSAGPCRCEKPAGGWNAPGGTKTAMVTVVCGSESLARSSQGAAERAEQRVMARITSLVGDIP